MQPFLRAPVLRVMALALSLLGVSRAAIADEVTRVFLFAGQSNMVGADAQAERIDDFPDYKGSGATRSEVLFSYLVGNGTSSGWKPLRPLSSFGPEMTFAAQVRKKSPGPIAIIKSAIGGTTVAFDWNPDAPEKGQKLYPRTLELVRKSLQDLDKRGIRYRLEAVMWHQGENDMLDRALYKQYAEGLKKLIARFRKDLRAPDLKWYIAEVSEKGIWGMDHRSNLGILRQQQQQVLQADPLTRWVPTSHLAFEVMGSGQPHYHYGTQGQLQLGDGLAEAWLGDQGQPAATVVRPVKKEPKLAPKSRVNLFVLAGQRNMEGEDSFVRSIPEVPGFASLTKDQEQTLYRYSLGGGVRVSKGWEPLGPVDFLGNFGPELSFGARLRQAIKPDEGLAIVKFTHSGAQGPDWFPKGSPESHRNLYPKFVAFVRQAREDLAGRGFNCKLAGIFWHTGENDTWFGPYAQNNALWMRQLIDRTRLDLQQPDLAWYITGQHKNAPWRNMESVNAALAGLAANDPRITLIQTSHLPHGRHHFETKGTLLLGEEMAKAHLDKR